jgi:hypothetical protein
MKQCFIYVYGICPEQRVLFSGSIFDPVLPQGIYVCHVVENKQDGSFGHIISGHVNGALVKTQRVDLLGHVVPATFDALSHVYSDVAALEPNDIVLLVSGEKVVVESVLTTADRSRWFLKYIGKDREEVERGSIVCLPTATIPQAQLAAMLDRIKNKS